MKIESISIESIQPADYNPRLDLKPGDPEYEKLRRSIEEFDIVEPLVWNRRTGNLVGGHQRLKILKAGGAKVVDVSVVDLDINREKALNIALNKISGDWDLQALKSVIDQLKAEEFDFTLTGFTEKDLKELDKESLAAIKSLADGITDSTTLYTGQADAVKNDMTLVVVFNSAEELRAVRDRISKMRSGTDKTVGQIVYETFVTGD